MLEPKQIPLKEIVMLPDPQVRVKISSKTVDEYAELMREGISFEAIELVMDQEGRKIIADGAHRFMAAEQNGYRTILARVHESDDTAGAISVALEISLEKNARHGLRLSNKDKRNAVAKVLDDKRLRAKGDRAIARMCGVSPSLVKEVRAGDEAINPKTKVRKHERSRPDQEREAEEVTADPEEERVRTMLEWKASGKLNFAMVKRVFLTETRTPVLFPSRAKVLEVIDADGMVTPYKIQYIELRITKVKSSGDEYLKIYLDHKPQQ
jgi:ParB-like chromosome segregation protein Spo0J